MTAGGADQRPRPRPVTVTDELLDRLYDLIDERLPAPAREVPEGKTLLEEPAPDRKRQRPNGR